MGRSGVGGWEMTFGIVLRLDGVDDRNKSVIVVNVILIVLLCGDWMS